VALTNAAVCTRRQGDLSQAETYLRRALDRNRRYPMGLGQMALVSFERGNSMSARAYLQRYMAVAEPSSEMLWLGVRVERDLGDDRAEREYAELLRTRFPDSLEVQMLQESTN
jgi:type IV pilus assembly protein PilF